MCNGGVFGGFEWCQVRYIGYEGVLGDSVDISGDFRAF